MTDTITTAPAPEQQANDLNTPWTLHFDRDGTEYFGVIYDADDREIVSSQHSKTCWLPATQGDEMPTLVRQMRLMKAAPKLLEAAKNNGGGDLYIEEYGRTCHCSFSLRKGGVTREQMVNHSNHATSCNDLWDAIAEATDDSIGRVA